MHGSPLLRTLGVLLVLLAAGVPLVRLTATATNVAFETPSAYAAAAAQPRQRVVLAVGFAARPVRFEVRYLGKTIWAEEPVTGLTAENSITMTVPKEGADLEYKVLWPPGTALTAARLSVAVDDGEPVEKTLWGTGQVDDVLTFP